MDIPARYVAEAVAFALLFCIAVNLVGIANG